MNQANEEKTLIKLGNYFLYKKIGTGATSVVYEAYDALNDRKVAIKQISKKQPTNGCSSPPGRLKLLSYVQNEKAILYNCKNNRENHSSENNQTHIVEILDSITTKDAYYIILELCESRYLNEQYTSLDRVISENKQNKIYMNEDQAILTLLQIFKGMQVLHENCICHRDLKPANTLLKKMGSGSQQLVGKISDFGFGKFFDELVETRLGTIDYVAPEILDKDKAKGKRKKYNPIQAEMYSLGVVFYEMLFNQRPGQQISFERNPPLSKDVQSILLQMLNPDPEKRIKWEKLNDELFLQRAFELSQQINDKFFRQWQNKIKLLEGTILLLDRFKTEDNKPQIDPVQLQLKKKKYHEMSIKIKEQEQRQATIMNQNRMKLNEAQRDHAKIACKKQIEEMLNYDYLFKTELLKPAPGQSFIMCETKNEQLMKSEALNLEYVPDRYQSILQEYIDYLDPSKMAQYNNPDQCKKIINLRFQIKLAQDFDNDFVNVFEENQQERINLLENSQPNVNNFEQLFSSITLQCGQLYFDQINRKNFESQVIFQEQN